VRDAANSVYEQALDALDGYCAAWLTAQGADPRTAERRAPARARVMVSLVYAQILQMSLIDGHDPAALASELGELLDRT